MKSGIREILEELRSDHRNMGVVLDLLEEFTLDVSAGNNPDFEVVEEIMRYMTVYPDAVHHPKEDIVYAELKERRPELAEQLHDIPADHRDIAALGSRLRAEAEAIVAGGAVRREKFIHDAREYVRCLRDHMRKEEQDLFRQVDEMIKADSTGVDVDQFRHIKDPVFELEVEAAFRRLLASTRTT